MRYAVRWTDPVAVLAIALVAGLLASVLPGRAAARTSPWQRSGRSDDCPSLMLTTMPVDSLCAGATGPGPPEIDQRESLTSARAE